MDRMQKWELITALTMIGIVLVPFAVPCVSASSGKPDAPLYTLRMEQASSGMNFLPTQVNNFVYTAEKGYTVNYDAAGCCNVVRGLFSVPLTCEDDCIGIYGFTLISTCSETCSACEYWIVFRTCYGSCRYDTCRARDFTCFICPNTEGPWTCDWYYWRTYVYTWDWDCPYYVIGP